MDFGLLILAGGRAARLPGKLFADTDARPMLARVLANVRDASAEIVVSTSAELAREVRRLVDVRVIVDVERGRGPLGGMVASFEAMRSPVIFTLAGDAPFVDAEFARALATRWRDGDEALVPERAAPDGGTSIEPLAALYDRRALVRAGETVLAEGRGAVRLALDRLAARYVRIDANPRTFANVNTPEDYAALRAQFAQETV